MLTAGEGGGGLREGGWDLYRGAAVLCCGVRWKQFKRLLLAPSGDGEWERNKSGALGGAVWLQHL